MNVKSIAAVGALLLFSVMTGGAQNALELDAPPAKSDPQFKLCETNEKTENAERAALETYSSPALEKALRSSRAFRDFITDPATPYMDRMAAASRGGSMLSPKELAWLWQAMAELDSVHWNGVNPPPCSAVAVNLPLLTRDALESQGHKPRETFLVVLGRKISLPQKSVPYPITAEERNASPWLWQVDRALSVLFDKTNAYYGDPSRYPARVKAAWDWSIAVPQYRPGEVARDVNSIEWNRVSIRSRALTEWAPHDTLLLQTILKLALNNDDYEVAYSGDVQDLYAWGHDSYHYEELAHVAQIAILEKTRWENVAAETAFVMASLATQKGNPSYNPDLKPLKTATGILAIGTWAVDKSLNPWNRYYGFVEPICRAVDDATCPSTQLRDPSDPRLDDNLKLFEIWFDRKKPELERQAESERPHVDSLAKELHIEIK